MITFDIPSDKNITKQQAILLTKLTGKKSRKGLTVNFIMGFSMLLFGILGGLSDGKFINPFSVIGAISLSFQLLVILIVTKYNKSYVSKIVKKFDHEFEYQKSTTYIFTEDTIAYSNSLQKVENSWVCIKGYTIFRDHIFIMFSEIVDQALIFGKTEIAEDNYYALVEILREKTQYLEY